MKNKNDKNVILKDSEISFENDCTFNKIKNLQILIKKGHYLKDQCKFFHILDI